MSPRAERWTLGAVVLVALAIRVAYVRHVGRDPLVGDGLEFHLLANLVADGRGWIDPFAAARGVHSPTADKPPLYTLTLAGLSLLGLRSPGEHHVSGVLTGVACVVVIARLARAVTGRREAGVLAGVLAAVYPPLIMADGSLRSESLFALLVACALLGAVRYRQDPRTRWATLTAAAVALAALTRGEGLLLAGLLPAAMWRWRPPGAARTHALLGTGVLILVLAPWLVRCWVVFDQPVAISTNTGGLIAGANCDETYRAGTLLGQWSLRCAIGDHPSAGNEAQIADALRARGLRYARDHARRLPVVLAVRMGRSFELYHPYRQAAEEQFYEGRALLTARLALPAFYLVVLLTAVALAGRRLRRVDAAILLAPVLVAVFVTLTAYGWPRLRAGAEPGLVVLAAVGFLVLADRVRGRALRTGSVR